MFLHASKRPIKKVEKRLKAIVNQPSAFLQSAYINGFSHPTIPVILDRNLQQIETNYSWGLIPAWTKNVDFRKNTLNARIETLPKNLRLKKL